MHRFWQKMVWGYIVGHFFTKSSGVDVMIIIFGDFCQFFAEKGRFSQNQL
jgi:hypothetical protein